MSDTLVPLIKITNIDMIPVLYSPSFMGVEEERLTGYFYPGR